VSQAAWNLARQGRYDDALELLELEIAIEAHQLGRGLSTVDNYLKRAGVKRPRQPVMTEADIDEAEAAYLAGESWATIALRFKVDPATIGRLLKLRGVKMRPRRGGLRRDGR